MNILPLLVAGVVGTTTLNVPDELTFHDAINRTSITPTLKTVPLIYEVPPLPTPDPFIIRLNDVEQDIDTLRADIILLAARLRRLEDRTDSIREGKVK